MTRPSLKQWLTVADCSGEEYWLPRSHKELPLRFHRELGVEPQLLSEEASLSAWKKLAEKIEVRGGESLLNSGCDFIWEYLHKFCAPEQPADEIPAGQVVLMYETLPCHVYLLESSSLRTELFQSGFNDYLVAPWPRLNWIISIPHARTMPPMYVDLKMKRV